MRKRALLVTLLMLVLVPVAGRAQENRKYRKQVTVMFDRVTGASTAALAPISIGFSFKLFANFIMTKDQPRPVRAAMALFSRGQSWRYIDCQHVNMLADGEPVTFIEDTPLYKGNVVPYGGGVAETFQMLVDIETFVRVSNATSVEWKVCNDVVALKPEHIAALRDLASRMPQ
jgi:hypothetical protein